MIDLFGGDQPMEDDHWYTVASSDYLQRGPGYESLVNNRNEKYRAEEIRDVIGIYASITNIEKAQIKRWTEANKIDSIIEKGAVQKVSEI